MLGRTVGEAIRSLGPQYPLGPVAALMRQADASIVNLECAITSSVQRWPGAPKAFYFGAPPQAIQTLTGAGVGLVSLANNHSLDYGFDGLLQTLHRLRRAGIQYAGAGIDLDEALAPAILDCQGIRLGMAAFCDHQADFAAQPDAPGMAWLDLDDEARTLAALHRALQALRREQVDWPILSLHWGPNMVWEPSERFRRLAHAAIDMGWKILFGHSAHIFHGVEIHHGCPIIYAAGDLVDDYLVDPVFRNDHQLLIELELDRDTLRGVRFYPVFIGMCQARMATPEQAGWIAQRMTRACEKMGTRVNGTTLA